MVWQVWFDSGVEVNNAEAQVLRKDPQFRDWCKINMEDIETDITVGLDNLRREVKMVVKLCLSGSRHQNEFKR